MEFRPTKHVNYMAVIFINIDYYMLRYKTSTKQSSNGFQ